MRHELIGGPKTARQLASAAGVRPKDVGALLRAEIALGRVLVKVTSHRGQNYGTYELVEDFDGDLHEQLKAARALLIRHGYSVSLSRRMES